MPKNMLTITYTGKKRRSKKGDKSKSLATGTLQNAQCCFCLSIKDKEEEFGKFIRKNGFAVHYFCLLFSSGLCQRGRTDKEGILGFLSKDIEKELSRGSRLKCEYCKRAGACIGCVIPSCRKKFHFVCGKENGSLHQFFDTFRSYCPDHRPNQTYIPNSKSKKNAICPICMCTVAASCSIDTLKSNCCKNAWFHRNCIQRYSLSAGLHFFKCPMCNNSDKFQKEMLEFGIYIPDQDASWETEPNAFNELLERHSVCDAENCKCPSGRQHDAASGKWELLLCSNCGSEGSHIGCNGLLSIKNNREQVCNDCYDIQQIVENEKIGKKKVPTRTPKKSSKDFKKLIKLTGAQKERRNRELQARQLSDKTTVNITHSETDTDVDVEETPNEENLSVAKWLKVSEQSTKRQRLSLTRSRRSSNISGNLVSANITVRDDSHRHSLTATISQSSSNNSVSVASSNVSTSYFPDLEYEDSEPEVSEEESDSSDNYSINAVTDLPQRKAFTISWRGKKVHITNPRTEEKHNSLDWSFQLQMGNHNKTSSNSSYTRSGLTRTSSEEDDYDKISPPILIPVDEDISIKCVTQNSMPPILSPRYDTQVDVLRSGSRSSLLRNIHASSFYTADETEVIPSISARSYFESNKHERIKPSTSLNSIISISSSDSDTPETQNIPKIRNKYLKLMTNSKDSNSNTNIVDLTDASDLPSSIRLIPRYVPTKPPVMEPEVVILD